METLGDEDLLIDVTHYSISKLNGLMRDCAERSRAGEYQNLLDTFLLTLESAHSREYGRNGESSNAFCCFEVVGEIVGMGSSLLSENRKQDDKLAYEIGMRVAGEQ